MTTLDALLRDRGADGIDHPGGTLGTHLERVERRLAALGRGRSSPSPGGPGTGTAARSSGWTPARCATSRT